MNIVGISFVFLLLVMLLLGGLAAVVALLVSPKTRIVGIVLLCVGGMFVLLVVGWRFASFSASRPMARLIPSRERNVTVTAPQSAAAKESSAEGIKSIQEFIQDHYGGASSQTAAKAALPPASAASAADKAARKAEAEPSGVIAARAVGMIEAMGQAMGQALSRMLTEEKTPAVAKKADAKPAPPPSKARPAWVNAPPGVVGDSYQMSIVLGPWKTRQECNAELPDKLQKALDDYVATCEPASSRIVLPTDYLRQHLVKQQWEQDIESETESIGAMKQIHVLLQFDREVKNRILDEARRGIAGDRLVTVLSSLAAVFWLLAIVYGYLRIDLATSGIYRGRLRLAAGLAILGPMVLTWAVLVGI
jgi:hypothetical protein